MARTTAARLAPGAAAATEEPQPPVAVLDEADAEEQDDIEGVISQVADEAATVQIKRWNPTPDDPGKPWDYITTVAARDFNLETIKREFGGGKYKAVTLDRSKKYVRGGTHLFNIDKMFKPAPPPKEEAGPATAKAAVSPDVAALMAKVDALAGLVAAQNSTKETLDYALKIAAVMGGRAGGGASPDAIFTTATKLIEFSRNLGGSGGDGDDGEGGGDEHADPYAVAVRELVKPIASYLQSEVERRTRARGAVPPGKAPAQLTAGDTVATAPAWVVQLRPYLPQLLTLARENADPALYADVVYDLMERKMPAAQLGAITEAAAKEDFVSAVVGALPPACVPFREWFQQLATNLKATLTAPPSPGEDDNDDDDAGPASS